MYIGCTQTSTRAGSTSTARLARSALGESTTLSWDALKRAVTLNRVYARALGWKQYTNQIAIRLGLTAQNPDIWSFVQALADWQGRNGIMPSGILGGEWHDLLTRNR